MNKPTSAPVSAKKKAKKARETIETTATHLIAVLSPDHPTDAPPELPEGSIWNALLRVGAGITSEEFYRIHSERCKEFEEATGFKLPRTHDGRYSIDDSF